MDDGPRGTSHCRRDRTPVRFCTPAGRRAMEGRPKMMEQVLKDARRLASIGTFFIVIGWVFVVYALVAGVIWWIDLAQREAFNIIEAFAISASAIGIPIFIAFVLAGFGYFLRLFALYVASKSQ
jgi:TRAP-type C4-dicarboxylate transport system permease small subunit